MDTVANMLSTIKNNSVVGRPNVEFTYSKLKESILDVLKSKNFIEDYKIYKPAKSSFKMLNVTLKYDNGTPRIREIKKVSKPGRRVYKGSSELNKVIGGYGIAIVSTSRGVMDSLDARRKKLGGEVICEVW